MTEAEGRAPLANETTAGILIAGGRATRMGGGDKALKTLGGLPILSRVVASLRPQCDALLINANGDPARFSAYGLPVVADDIEGYAGPLAGILAGLDFVAAYLPEVKFAVTVAADTPFIPNDLVVHLHDARRQEQADLACATSGGSTHHVIALWPVEIRTALRRAIVDEDLHAVHRFTSRYKMAHADWPVTPYDPFFNANEPGDIAAAEAMLSGTAAAIRI